MTRRSSARAAFAALMVVRAAAAEPAWTTPGAEEAATARRLAASGRCAEALDAFDRAAEARSEDATVRRDRGLCHEQLGHPRPAIDDYRAYLSLSPTAPDAAQIKARLDALERADGHEARTAGPSGGAAAAPGSATGEAGATTLSTTPEEAPPETPPETGWLVGLALGARGWSSEGYPHATTAYGLEVGWAYARSFELDGRFVLLNTKEKTSGFGLSVVNAWKLSLDDYDRYQLGLGLGLGFESQSNDIRISRQFFFVRAMPAFRWAPVAHVALDLGPDIGLGSITQAPDATSVATARDSSAFALYYGGHFSILWFIEQ